MKQFLQYVLGTSDIPMYAALWFFACLGILLSLLIGAVKRKPDSPHTPFSFSWKFLWSDNFRRILATATLVFITFRFTEQLIGTQISLWAAFLIGLGHDQLAAIAKKKNFMKIGK